MAYNPSGEAEITYLDFSNEKSRFKVNSAVLNAGNIAAQITAFGNLITATNAIVLGSIAATKLHAVDTVYSAVLPTDVNAQRERKWLVRFQDDVNLRIGGTTIPTADYTGRLLPGTDLADLTDTDIAAFVTEFEAFAKSPDGNAVTVLQMVAVGRNL